MGMSGGEGEGTGEREGEERRERRGDQTEEREKTEVNRRKRKRESTDFDSTNCRPGCAPEHAGRIYIEVKLVGGRLQQELRMFVVSAWIAFRSMDPKREKNALLSAIVLGYFDYVRNMLVFGLSPIPVLFFFLLLLLLELFVLFALSDSLLRGFQYAHMRVPPPTEENR
eukprot:417908-Hanusia_phi.AAC.2